MPHFKWHTFGSDSCFSCMRWNQKVFNSLSEVPDLPVHPNCRCKIEVINSAEDTELKQAVPDIQNIQKTVQKDLYELSVILLSAITYPGLLGLAQGLVSELRQMLLASYIFLDNYLAMRDADFIGADKYFHAKANAEAAQLGPTAETIAEILSSVREYRDYYNNLYLKKMSLEATLEDMKKDQQSNVFGREQGRKYPNTDSKILVDPLKPKGFEDVY
jgi:hypothetical protein